MRSTHLRAELPLCAVLLVGCLAISSGVARAAFPTTAQEQAAWLGDAYAAGLREHYPQGLPDQSIASTRDALVRGIEGLLAEPMKADELSELTVWVSRSTGMGKYTPPDLELLSRRANLLQIIELYLARPALSDQERGELLHSVLRQVGGLLGTLRRALAADFAGVSAADEMAAAVVFSEGALIAEAARSPVSPFAKRLLTDEEVADLAQQAERLAGEAHSNWSAREQQVLEITGAPDPLSAQAAGNSMVGAASQFEGSIRTLYYAAPQVLTAEQQTAVWEYYHDLFLADVANEAAEGGDE